jgi:hypothetical protein
MTDNTVIEEQPQDVTAPVDAPASPPEQSIDDLLAEWDAKVGQQQPEPAADGNVSDGNVSTDQTLDRQTWEDLLGPDPRISELQGQVDAFKAGEFQRQEREAATKWAAELQDVCARSNPNVESDFVIREIKILSADNPGILEAAWQYRNLSDADLANAKRDFTAAEQLYQKVLAQPDTEPQKQNALRYLEQRGARLQAMLSARSVIWNARNEIRKRADTVKAGYDEEVSGWRTEIAASMRGASMPIDFKEPPPDFSGMSDAEFRDFTRRNYGF